MRQARSTQQPRSNATTVASQLLFKEHCQLNGVLDRNGGCLCDAGWRGEQCGQLALLPARPGAGLRAPGNSSWGAHISWDAEHQEYVMFVSVFQGGCGLHAWNTNSAIARATSARADGPYIIQEIVKGHFAHSPEVLRNSAGEWLLYNVGAGDGPSLCAAGRGASCAYVEGCSGGCSSERKWSDGLGLRVPVTILAANSSRGPWRERIIGSCDEVPGCFAHGNDVNPAPAWASRVGVSDGSIKMLWRSINKDRGGESYIAAAHAPRWDGPYTWDTRDLFPDHGSLHMEDPFLWKGSRGWHALIHADVERTQGGAAGVHAWSVDGEHWALSPTNAFGSVAAMVQQRPLHGQGTAADGGAASGGGGSSSRDADSSREEFLVAERRERPKLIFNAAGQPSYLITSVKLKSEPCDRTFTLVQPIAVAPAASLLLGKQARRGDWLDDAQDMYSRAIESGVSQQVAAEAKAALKPGASAGRRSFMRVGTGASSVSLSRSSINGTITEFLGSATGRSAASSLTSPNRRYTLLLSSTAGDQPAVCMLRHDAEAAQEGGRANSDAVRRCCLPLDRDEVRLDCWQPLARDGAEGREAEAALGIANEADVLVGAKAGMEAGAEAGAEADRRGFLLLQEDGHLGIYRGDPAAPSFLYVVGPMKVCSAADIVCKLVLDNDAILSIRAGGIGALNDANMPVNSWATVWRFDNFASEPQRFALVMPFIDNQVAQRLGPVLRRWNAPEYAPCDARGGESPNALLVFYHPMHWSPNEVSVRAIGRG